MATNQREIRAFGLQRSGNHAVLSWVLGQYPGQRTCFLNNIRHGNHDPYATYHGRVLQGLPTHIEDEALRATPKEVLIYSYEDTARKMRPGLSFLESVFDDAFESHRADYVGESEKSYDVLIIRDPYNFFSSRLKTFERLTGMRDIEWLVENWKDLARKVMTIERENEGALFVVNYNRWRANAEYRFELARHLEGEGNDRYYDSKPLFSGASSFESDRITPEALVRKWYKVFNIERLRRLPDYYRRLTAPPPSGNQVINRWKDFAEDPRFRRVAKDQELEELARELFADTVDIDGIIAACR
jgi:hypothetical protein